MEDIISNSKNKILIKHETKTELSETKKLINVSLNDKIYL